jgi:hypothetical protein
MVPPPDTQQPVDGQPKVFLLEAASSGTSGEQKVPEFENIFIPSHH